MLDEFIDDIYISLEYTIEDIPNYFYKLKKFLLSIGVEPYYVRMIMIDLNKLYTQQL